MSQSPWIMMIPKSEMVHDPHQKTLLLTRWSHPKKSAKNCLRARERGLTGSMGHLRNCAASMHLIPASQPQLRTALQEYSENGWLFLHVFTYAACAKAAKARHSIPLYIENSARKLLEEAAPDATTAYCTPRVPHPSLARVKRSSVTCNK
jgi:hypothetical protein